MVGVVFNRAVPQLKTCGIGVPYYKALPLQMQTAGAKPENDREAFIDTVTDGVTQLQPIIRRYVENRGDLFIPQLQ